MSISPVTRLRTYGRHLLAAALTLLALPVLSGSADTQVTASANQPTLSVQRTPTPLVAGQNHTVSWSSTKATTVTYSCTASGTGFAGSATLATSGSATNATSAAWVGYLSTCTWKATGAGGSTTFVETMTTVAAPAVDSVTYFHNDIAGTPQLATNASGAVVWKENYLPYGQRQAQAPASAGNKLWYTGKPHEEDTGLTYMGARYYMPLVGRFAGIDPVDIVPEQPHSLNRYAYGNNNPYRYVDPDGRSPVLVWALRGATVLVVAAANSTPEQRAQMARAGERAVQSAVDALGQLRNSVFNESAEGADNAGSNQEGLGTTRPDDAPAGTLGLDQAGKKYGWDKDTTHGIKDEASGGMSNGKTWIGVAPDGTVGINENGRWSPQTSVDLKPGKKR